MTSWRPNVPWIKSKRTSYVYLVLASVCAFFLMAVSSIFYSKPDKPPPAVIAHRLREHKEAVYSLAYSPDGSTLATGGDDHIVRLYDPASGRLRMSLLGHVSRVSALCFTGDNEILATGSFDCSVRLWKVSDGSSEGVIKIGTNISSVAFSPDKSRLAVGDFEGYVRIWDWRIEPAHEVASLKLDSTWIMSLAFSPDGRFLAAAADHGVTAVDLGNIAQRRQFAIPGGLDFVLSLAYAPDGRHLVAGSGVEMASGRLTIWDVSDPLTPTDSVVEPLPVAAVSFSRDGRRVAWAGWDGVICIGELQAHSLSGIKRYVAHWGAIPCMAIAPDGLHLASGSLDRTVLIWTLVE